MHTIQTRPEPAIRLWFRELLRGPVAPNGDYFDRLLASIESSAPVKRCP